MPRPKSPKPAAPVRSPLEKAILARERGIVRMEEHKKQIRADAERQCGEIDKRIAEKRVLLDAMKRGAIQ